MAIGFGGAPIRSILENETTIRRDHDAPMFRLAGVPGHCVVIWGVGREPLTCNDGDLYLALKDHTVTESGPTGPNIGSS